MSIKTESYERCLSDFYHDGEEMARAFIDTRTLCMSNKTYAGEYETRQGAEEDAEWARRILILSDGWILSTLDMRQRDRIRDTLKGFADEQRLKLALLARAIIEECRTRGIHAAGTDFEYGHFNGQCRWSVVQTTAEPRGDPESHHETLPGNATETFAETDDGDIPEAVWTCT